VRFGGWPLPTQRGREGLSATLLESQGAFPNSVEPPQRQPRASNDDIGWARRAPPGLVGSPGSSFSDWALPKEPAA
jgi:hypothetical protein